MKYTLLLLSLLFCSITQAQTILQGKITSEDDGEPLIGALVSILKNEVPITQVATDFDGYYLVTLDPGTYDVEVSYTGFPSKIVTEIIVKAGHVTDLDIELDSGSLLLDELVITEYKVPLIQQDMMSSGSIISSEQIRPQSSGSSRSRRTKKARRSKSKSKKRLFNKGTKANGKNHNNNGIRLSTYPATKAQLKKSQTPSTGQHLPHAGQLTAGEWKDLDHWSFWDQLMKDEQFANYRKQWGFYPNHRFELKLSDPGGRSLSHIEVHLLNHKQEVVWTGISDNKGAVCLWGNFNGGTARGFEFKILHPEGTKRMPAIPYSTGLNSIPLPSICNTSKEVDIAFVVDVSGSMDDEIHYLRAEINDVIKRASSDETELEVRTGAVFYSGENEKQFLNSSPLTNGTETTATFLRESPLGGGDHEAVHIGLGIAIREFDWNPSAMARLVFVLLDEPPRNNEPTRRDLHQVVQEAAAKGIKVIPVAASGIDKSTEFLLKFIAMGTNSTYTFLTNHSGIGGHHITPEAKDYNIEPLNDLLVRLIIENGEYHECEKEKPVIAQLVKTHTAYQEVNRSEENQKYTKQFRLAPNPASSFVNIDLDQAVELLTITTLEGQMVAQYPQLAAGQIHLDTSHWQAGMYLIHYKTTEGYGVMKLVVEPQS